MGLFKIIRLIVIFLTFCHQLEATNSLSKCGRILFLVQQGEQVKGIELYRQYVQEQGHHDFDLLHQIGLGIVEYGFRQSDPESQLFALFGASIALHEDVYHILEESLKSRYPQIQLVALSALSRIHHDRADQTINRALSSPHLLIRLEAAHQLCLKKHPQAVTQTESLMYKTPKELLPIYPKLYAIVGDERSIRILRRMLNDPSEKVRAAVILSAAKYGRDDLLPQIRQQTSHLNYIQQEACAYALGVLRDEQSISKLKILARSSYPHVALAAQRSLYQLGDKSVIPDIEKAAKQENLFAISILSEIPESIPTLIQLLRHPNIHVKTNATLALLEQDHLSCFLTLPYLLMHSKRDLAFIRTFSPGRALQAWKVVSSANRVLEDDIAAYATNLQLKEEVLTAAQQLSEEKFLQLADAIFASGEQDLVPTVVELLEEIATPEAIQLLQKYQQKIGAPLIRNYCNLALYRLKEPGPYGELLRQWVKSQNSETLIQFRPFVPWELRTGNYELTPEETSRLLIEAFEAFATNQDEQGIDALLQAIQYGNDKNKYALAGLLIRATQ